MEKEQLKQLQGRILKVFDEAMKRLNDHIKPCAKFNLENSLEQKLCFLYKNLQPLWAEENLEKRDKYDSRKERSSYC